MSSLRSKLGILAASLMLAGCMETGATVSPTNEAAFKPHDKELLSKVSYEKVQVPDQYRRAIVDYHRKEAPGTILVDSDNHYLYLVQDGGKAIRYGITVGEEAMAWSGVAKVGAMTEWPAWHPTPGEIQRLGVPTYVAPGPDNPMGSRAMYLYSGNKDTLYRIHGTNQPSTIGKFVSSGCIGMLNEDVTDLFERTKVGTRVVVLPGGPPPGTATASAAPQPGAPMSPVPVSSGHAAANIPGTGPTVVPPLPAPVTIR